MRSALGLVLVAVVWTSPVLADPGLPCAAPAEPIATETVRIVVAGDHGSSAGLAIVDPTGHAVGESVAHDGPPWSIVATIAKAVAGTYRVTLGGAACGGIVVTNALGRLKPDRSGAGAWATRLEWSQKTEMLYSAWIEHLFAAPFDAEMSFPSLEPVLRDPARNFLYDHLGLGEDSGPRAAVPHVPQLAPRSVSCLLIANA